MLSLIIDIIVLLCLGVTIFYAMRLSTALNNFKAHRKEFQGLMEDLSQNIAQAQNAIAGLKAASRKTGEDLQDQTNDAVALCDELQLMIGSGNRLAERLEVLADQNSQTQNSQTKAPIENADEDDTFAIQDPDFEADSNIEPFSPRETDDEDDVESEAEKDLLRALKNNNNG